MWQILGRQAPVVGWRALRESARAAGVVLVRQALDRISRSAVGDSKHIRAYRAETLRRRGAATSDPTGRRGRPLDGLRPARSSEGRRFDPADDLLDVEVDAEEQERPKDDGKQR